jgi:hypothetical protein
MANEDCRVMEFFPGNPLDCKERSFKGYFNSPQATQGFEIWIHWFNHGSMDMRTTLRV